MEVAYVRLGVVLGTERVALIPTEASSAWAGSSVSDNRGWNRIRDLVWFPAQRNRDKYRGA